ncbi:MAG: winged-helix domain-containing protein [Caldilineaceae bacterium]|nr:winged-helix domain-containing protein [Caldilineaceae bacterium]MCB0082216.1 winged-helix domain-containing protein [Caldilineaceae bacterium]
MTDLLQFRILFVGRKAQLADHLHALFGQQNHIARERQRTLRTAKRRAQEGSDVEWPTVEFINVTNQKEALQLIRSWPPAVVLVELEQKPASRLRFCQIVHYRLPTVAIFAVAAILPTDSFAFDGLIKLPIVDEEVIRVVRTLGQKRADHELQSGPIRLNMAARTVITPNGQYTMTPKQCALLKLFMLEQGQVIERSKIMESVWETSYLEDTRTLDVHIRWLRERIEPDPSNPVYLKTVRGVGYRFSINGR